MQNSRGDVRVLVGNDSAKAGRHRSARPIEHVEEVHVETQPHLFSNRKLLEQRGVHIPLAGPADKLVSERTAGCAIPGRSGVGVGAEGIFVQCIPRSICKAGTAGGEELVGFIRHIHTDHVAFIVGKQRVA